MLDSVGFNVRSCTAGPMLLQAQLHTVTEVVDLGPVLTPHSGAARYVVDAAGRYWVRKDYTKHRSSLLAEALGWLVGRMLKVPMPVGAVHVGSDNTRAWLSEQIPTVMPWDESDASFLLNGEELGAMLTLDALIFVEDRHVGNLLLEPDPDPTHLRGWVIDCDAAAIGNPLVFSSKGVAPPSPVALAAGLPLDLMGPPALEAARFASAVADRDIRAAVSEACFASECHPHQLLSALQLRMRQAPQIVAAYLREIEALR